MMRRQRPGVSLVYTTALMVVLIGFLSLAVDVGRVQLARMELRTAADGAAFAGAPYLRPDRELAVDKALEILGANKANGEEIPVVADEDVVLGKWRWYSETFEEAPDSTSRVNAMRVTARRDADRGNPINLFFARILGFNSWDVGAPATVMLTGGRATLGIVGIDSLSMIGTAETDSYNSSEGAYDPNDHYDNGDIASNGVISLTGTVDVNGSLHTGPDGDLDAGSNTTITGDEFPFPEDLEYPPVDASPYASSNYNTLIADLENVPSNKEPYKPATHDLLVGANIDFALPGIEDPRVPAGTTVVRYHFHNVTIHGTADITVGQNVEVYVTGSMDVAGNIGPAPASGSPADFKILVDGGGTIKITGQGNQNNYFGAVLYAPEAPITIGGNTDFYGAVIGKSLDIQGTAGIHYDEALGYEQEWPEETILVE